MKTLISACALLAFLAANTLPIDASAQTSGGAAAPAPESSAPAVAPTTPAAPTTKSPTHKTTKHTTKKKTKPKATKSSTNKKAAKPATQGSLQIATPTRHPAA
jgi:hypothetical protein